MGNESKQHIFREPVRSFIIPPVAALLLLFFSWAQYLKSSPENIVPVDDGYESIELSKNTIWLGENDELYAKSSMNFELSSQQMTVSIPGLLESESKSAFAFKDGLELRIDRANQVGWYRLLVKSNNLKLAEVPVAVVDRNDPVSIDDIFGEIHVGEATISRSGGVRVPIHVTLNRIQDGVVVPAPAPSSASISISDASRNQQVISLIIGRGEAVSNTSYIPLERKSNRTLKGVVSFKGSMAEIVLNSIPFDWQNYGPKLRLTVDFADRETYACGITQATVRAYLTIDGKRRIQPFESVPISIKQPSDVSCQPDSIELDPDMVVAKCEFRSSKAQTTEIILKENSYGSETKVKIKFNSARHFYWYAIIGSVIALGATRWKHYFEIWQENRIASIFEVVGIIAGTIVVFGLFLAGLIPDVLKNLVQLDAMTAIAFGIAGGMLGLGVFKLIAFIVGIAASGTEAR